MLRALFSRTPSPSQTTMIDIAFDGATYRINVKRHRQARRYTLRIQAAAREVLLTMPPRGNLKEAKAFAQTHGGWIAARLNRLPEAVPFADGAMLPLRGRMHRIAHRPGSRGTVWIEDGPCASESLLCVAGEAAHLHRRVADFLKREARRDLDAASRRHAALLGVRIERISVRDTSSRWGSCSAAGALSFSWRLVLAPPHVLDYLAAHEVAHLVEMNHSRKFWRVLREICPGMNQSKVWLDAHGGDLHRYGAA
jgi:predicted metal-dependent hydrolase